MKRVILNTLCGNARGLQSFDGLGLRTFLIAINGLNALNRLLSVRPCFQKAHAVRGINCNCLSRSFYIVENYHQFAPEENQQNSIERDVLPQQNRQNSELCFSQALPSPLAHALSGTNGVVP